jgi:hypothetical protein
MSKVLLEKYPLGSFNYQKTAGRYFDEALKSNIDIMAKNIVNDMQFLGLCCTSTFEVRSGKSTFMQQIGEYYTYAVNKMHNLNLNFSMENIAFSSEEFIKKAFKLPRYSFIYMDENDEVDEHYYSKLAKDLRTFFKKSGQLNLFSIIITPNYFQLRPWLAIGRSNFLIDVKFEGEFERGYFSFYNFPAKRDLFVLGKKTMNYNVAKPQFSGRFLDGYAVDKQAYLAAKKLDLEKMDEKVKPLTERDIIMKNIVRFREKCPDISVEKLARGFGLSRTTLFNLISDAKQSEKGEGLPFKSNSPNIIPNPMNKKGLLEAGDADGEMERFS